MNSKERQAYILSALHASGAPKSAAAFSRELGVSRQVVVGDVALLRASGESILSTPRGYVLEKESEGLLKVLACCHGPEDTEKELQTIVYFGGEVVDVTVSHPIYGQISAPLNISSSHDVEEFMKKIREHKASLLSHLTEGVHLHSVRVKDFETYRLILSALEEQKLLYHSAD